MASVAMDFEDTKRFSIGRVIARASGTVARNPVVTIGMALLLGALPAFILTLVFRGALTGQAGALDANVVSGMTGAMFLMSLGIMAVSLVVQGGLTRATVADSEGRRASFGECVMAGFKVFLPLLGLFLLLWLGLIVGFTLLLVPGIILMLMWSVAVPALVEEREGVMNAFGRSRFLTKGERWKIFGLLCILFVAYMLLATVLNVVGLGATVGMNSADTAMRNLSIAMVVSSLLTSTLFNLAWGTIQPALYVELRNLKDGGSVGNLHEVFA